MKNIVEVVQLTGHDISKQCMVHMETGPERGWPVPATTLYTVVWSEEPDQRYCTPNTVAG